MALLRSMNLVFPTGGLDESLGYQRQRPFTTPDALNVRPDGSEGRERGGTRPGLSKAYSTDLGGAVQMLNDVSYISSTGEGGAVETTFDELDPFSEWTALTEDLPGVLRDRGAIDVGDAFSAAIKALPADFSAGSLYTVSMYIHPDGGQHNGTYQLYAQTSGGDPFVDGVVAELTLAANGAYSGTVKRYASSAVAQSANFSTGNAGVVPGLFTLSVNGSTVTATWAGVSLVSTSFTMPTISGTGFGIQSDVEGGAAVAEYFRTNYVSAVSGNLVTKLIAIADGKLYSESTGGTMEEVATGLADDRLISSAEWGSKLYIANWGTSNDPKIYDPSDESIATWTATSGKGTVPTQCPLIAVYRGRLVLGGASSAPHVWYMSRQDDPLDWLYSDEDAQAAVSGAASEAGQIADPLRALVAHSDDYLLFGCDHSLWVLRGDPGFGGQIDRISNTVGVIHRNGWCWGPSSEFIFLSRDGVHWITAGADSFPQSLSERPLPERLQRINTNIHYIAMAYDQWHHGVHLFVTPTESNRKGQHWWFDWQAKSWWPVDLKYEHQPTVAHSYNSRYATTSRVVLGSLDGHLRSFTCGGESDDGTAINCYVDIGPFMVGDNFSDGMIQQLTAVLGENGGGAAWSLRVDDSAERAFLKTATDANGTLVAGANRRWYPRSRGMNAVLRIACNGSRPWMMEHANLILKRAGKQRV